MVSCRPILPQRWSRERYRLWWSPAMAIVNSMSQRCGRRRVCINRSQRWSWFAHFRPLSALPIDLHKQAQRGCLRLGHACGAAGAVTSAPMLDRTGSSGGTTYPVVARTGHCERRPRLGCSHAWRKTPRAAPFLLPQRRADDGHVRNWGIKRRAASVPIAGAFDPLQKSRPTANSPTIPRSNATASEAPAACRFFHQIGRERLEAVGRIRRSRETNVPAFTVWSGLPSTLRRTSPSIT